MAESHRKPVLTWHFSPRRLWRVIAWFYTLDHFLSLSPQVYQYAFSTQNSFSVLFFLFLLPPSPFLSLLPGVERDGFGVYKRDDPRVGHHLYLILGYGSDGRGAFYVLCDCQCVFYFWDILLCEGLFEGLLVCLWWTLTFLEYSARCSHKMVLIDVQFVLQRFLLDCIKQWGVVFISLVCTVCNNGIYI